MIYILILLFALIIYYIRLKPRRYHIKRFLLVEAVALFTSACVLLSSFYILRIMYGQAQVDYLDTIYETATEDVEDTSIPVNKFIYDMIGKSNDLSQCYYNSQNDHAYGHILQVYNNQNQLIYASNKNNNCIAITSYSLNLYQIYNLEDYLSNKESEDFLLDYEHGFDDITVYGIVVDNQLIPSEIDFKAEINTYQLGERGDYKVVMKLQDEYIDFFQMDTSEEIYKKMSNACELSEYTPHFLNERYINLDYGNYINSYSGESKDGEYSYDYIVYINVNKVTLNSDLFSNRVIPYTIDFNLVVLCIYFIYAIIHQKNEELEEIRDLFINAIAHEMKTPAAILLNGSEMLAENIYPEKNGHYIQVIHKEANHINELLMNMLDYTRTKKGYKLNKESIDLNQAVSLILSKYSNDNIQVEINIPDHTTIKADAHMIEMVIDNFISNAYRHADKYIKLDYTNHTFTITNSGELIPEDQVKNLWTPLFQLDDSRNDVNHSGMGLAISANILSLHHFKYGMYQKEHEVSFYFKTK